MQRKCSAIEVRSNVIKPNHLRRHRFTLLELLTVLSIIIMLAALLFPALHKARELSKSTLCTGNLKQIMLGTLSYAQDNNLFIHVPYDQPTMKAWTVVMIPDYIQDNPLLWSCPSLPLEPSIPLSQQKYGMKYPTNVKSNVAALRLGRQYNIKISGILTQVGASSFILWGDSVCESSGGKNIQWYILEDNWWNIYVYNLHLRHISKANCAFVDGHVSTIKLSELPNLGFDLTHCVLK